MIIIPTSTPQKLLNAFSAAISGGDITTWERDKDGDFTHKASQWAGRAWMVPTIVAGTSLNFTITFSQNEDKRRLVYAYYHGHLVEALITHFAGEIPGLIEVTPGPAGSDARV